MTALVNCVDKLIGLLAKLRENISEEAKEKLKEIVEEIGKIVK